MNLKQLEKRSRAKAAIAAAKRQITSGEYGEVLHGRMSVQGGYLLGLAWWYSSYNLTDHVKLRHAKIIRKLDAAPRV